MSQTIGKAQGSHELDALWDDLLSRQKERVRIAFASLSVPEQVVVLAHLHRMISEPGWQPGQRASARAALRALGNQAK